MSRGATIYSPQVHSNLNTHTQQTGEPRVFNHSKRPPPGWSDLPSRLALSSTKLKKLNELQTRLNKIRIPVSFWRMLKIQRTTNPYSSQAINAKVIMHLTLQDYYCQKDCYFYSFFSFALTHLSIQKLHFRNSSHTDQNWKSLAKITHFVCKILTKH